MKQPSTIDLNEQIDRLHELEVQQQEYERLSATAVIVAVIGSLAQLISTYAFKESKNEIAGIISGFAISGAFIYGFLLKAHRSSLGIRGMIAMERDLLINEMPNIFQIISLLGFLNVLLSDQLIRLVTSMIITFLLSVYLTAKRRQVIRKLPQATQEGIGTDLTTLLSIALAIIIGGIVYGLASLVSIQLTITN